MALLHKAARKHACIESQLNSENHLIHQRAAGEARVRQEKGEQKEGGCEPDQLVREKLKEEPVTGREQSRHQLAELIVAHQRASLARELARSRIGRRIVSYRSRLEHN